MPTVTAGPDQRVNGLKVASYHVYMPATSDGRKITPEAQMEKYLRAMDNKQPDWYPVLDCEKHRNQDKFYITDGIFSCLQTLDINYNDSIVYTRGSWWQENVIRNDFNDWDLFIARYKPGLEHPWEDDPNTDPLDWDDYDLWQYSADGNGRGAEFGAASRSIDISKVNDPNYFNLTNGDEPTMSNLENFLKLMEQYKVATTANIEYVAIGDMPTDPGNGGNGNGGNGEPPAPPAGTKLIVTAGLTDKAWALAYFEKGENSGGYPIMEIYPSANSPANDRIKWVEGAILYASEKVTADGKDRFGDRNKFWKLTGDGSVVEGKQLFIHQKDVIKAE